MAGVTDPLEAYAEFVLDTASAQLYMHAHSLRERMAKYAESKDALNEELTRVVAAVVDQREHDRYYPHG